MTATRTARTRAAFFPDDVLREAIEAHPEDEPAAIITRLAEEAQVPVPFGWEAIYLVRRLAAFGKHATRLPADYVPPRLRTPSSSSRNPTTNLQVQVEGKTG